MTKIESVKILKSQIEHGGEIKPCLAVVIDPWPADKHDIIQIGDNITATVKAYGGKL